MDKEMMHWCDFSLFKVGFNYLINKLSFILNWYFVLAVSRIEKKSREQAFKQSADDINVGIYVTFYPYRGVHWSCLWDGSTFHQHN